VRSAADGELSLRVRDAELLRLRQELQRGARRRESAVAAGVLWWSGLAWLIAGPRYPLAGLLAMGIAVLLFVSASRGVGQRRDP
jgi:hypothetical protein